MIADRIRQSGGIPIPLNGLQMWLKADQGVTLDGNGRVSQWNDQSSAARNVSQSASGQRPLLVSSAKNSLPAIQFTSTRQDVLESLTSTGVDNCSIFTVIKVDSTDFTEDVFVAIGKGFNPQRVRFLYKSGSNTNIGFAGWNNEYTASGIDWDTGNWHVAGLTQNNQDVLVFRDTTTASGTLPNTSLTTNQDYWGIGASSQTGAGSYWTNCHIGEVIIYNRAVSTNERTQITAYLKARWATP